MNLLIEATFLNFKYITGIERHFFLQLEILEKSKIFDKVYVVVKNDIPKKLLSYGLKLEIIKILDNSVENWIHIYKNYKFNLVYSTFVPPPILPPNMVPVIYVLHDPGRYVYPELMEKGTLDEHMRLFGEYVDSKQFFVITVSESSKKDILRYFPALEGRIFVIYNFISEKFRQLRNQNLPDKDILSVAKHKFFLTVGRYMPIKNTLSIVKAFEKRTNVFKDFKLVIIGRRGWYEELDNYLENYRFNDVIIFNYIEDNELFSLYKNCYGFISASLYEGFGLPIIEAKFCGCKRIFCSDISVYHEIDLRGVVYFDPYKYLDLKDKVFTSLINPVSCTEAETQINKISLNVVADELKKTIKHIIEITSQ